MKRRGRIMKANGPPARSALATLATRATMATLIALAPSTLLASLAFADPPGISPISARQNSAHVAKSGIASVLDKTGTTEGADKKARSQVIAEKHLQALALS